MIVVSRFRKLRDISPIIYKIKFSDVKLSKCPTYRLYDICDIVYGNRKY